ncbi:MAG: tRNA (adenosine(37)-N6)-threonylcarbamoyltransferase complex dimerization subunit type 1 TsaB, partial [Verrucomicrobiota bacterium]
MSLILAIESSTPRASLALLRDSEVVFEGSFESDRNHNAMLFEPLRWSLAELGGEPLDLVLIGTGPGSYSGTRVGIAAGQGVAMIHACPAIGLSSLLALGVNEGTVVGDARRGSAWLAELGDGLPQPEVVATKALGRRLKSVEKVFALEEIESLRLPNR